MGNRSGREIPAAVMDGCSFDFDDVGSQRLSVVSLEKPQLWSARFDDPDKSVAKCNWVTEIGLGKMPDGRLAFGVRTTCVNLGRRLSQERTVPHFLRGILARGGVYLDGILIRSEPQYVESFEEVCELRKVIIDPTRTAPVIVLTTGIGSSDPRDTSLDAYELHRQTMGVAHVFVLGSRGTFHLSDLMGREFSVYQRGIRTYFPSMDFGKEQPFQHPILFEGRIRDRHGMGENGFLRQLISSAVAVGVQRKDKEERLPSFARLKEFAASLERAEARKAASSDSDLLQIADGEIAQLRNILERERREFDELLAAAELERDQAKEDAQQAKARTFNLVRRVELLEARLAGTSGSVVGVEIPDNLDVLQQWCADNLTGEVEVLSRAYQGVKKSLYEDHTLIYRGLLLLRDHYVPMRRLGGEDRKVAYERALRENGLDDTWCFAGKSAGEFGDEYKVQWGGRTRELERHLRKGYAKDQRLCFRMYYFWDADTEQVVVGWMPSHLNTRHS